MMEEKKKQYCEICGALIGIMSDKAFQAGHKHCDRIQCESACVKCGN
jgi:hypothetical protein